MSDKRRLNFHAPLLLGSAATRGTIDAEALFVCCSRRTSVATRQPLWWQRSTGDTQLGAPRGHMLKAYHAAVAVQRCGVKPDCGYRGVAILTPFAGFVGTGVATMLGVASRSGAQSTSPPCAFKSTGGVRSFTNPHIRTNPKSTQLRR